MFNPKSVQDIKASYEARNTAPPKPRSITPPDSPTTATMPKSNSPFANKQSIDSVLNQAKANIDKFNDQVKNKFNDQVKNKLSDQVKKRFTPEKPPPAASTSAAPTAAVSSPGPSPAPVVPLARPLPGAAPVIPPANAASAPALAQGPGPALPTPALPADDPASPLPSPAVAPPTPALFADDHPAVSDPLEPPRTAPVNLAPAIASQAPVQLAAAAAPDPALAPCLVAPTLTSPADVRPPASKTPSWIGPPRSLTPSMAKHTVTVEHSSSGLQPPVYIFTSLSDPQWTAVEMDTQKKEGGEYRFFKTFQVDEGEYQYKFRLGPGDWWALDDSKPTVDDGMGNKNNLLLVRPDPPKPQIIDLPKAVAQAEAIPTPAAAPLMEHEKSLFASMPSRDNAPQSTAMPPTNVSQLGSDTTGTKTPAAGPLLKHEAFQSPSSTLGDEYRNDDLADGEEGEEDEAQTSPLLRHESLCPTSDEQTQAPLLRHESTSIGEHHDDGHAYAPTSPSLTSLSSRGSSDDAVAPEADPNDPSLERFPTDKRGIFDHIHRTSTSIPEDQYHDDVKEGRHQHAGSQGSTGNIPPMPSVVEDEVEEMEKIREEEVKTAQDDEDEVDPNDMGLDAPAIVVTDGRPAEPITPPLTPKEDSSVIFGHEHQDHQEHLVKRHPGHKRRPLKGEDDVVKEFKQEKGVIGTVLDVAVHPVNLFAVAGVLLAVAAGYWKLR